MLQRYAAPNVQQRVNLLNIVKARVFAMEECRLLDHLQQLLGDAGASREDADAVVVTVTLDEGTSLLGDEFAGTGIPLLEIQFPIAVEPPGGDIAHIHGR